MRWFWECCFWGAAIASVAANLFMVWRHHRAIRAYYDAHELLMDLCIRAWQLRDRGELWPIYQRTIDRLWTEHPPGGRR